MDRKFDEESKTECLLPSLRQKAFYLPELQLVAILGNDNKLRKKNCSRRVVYTFAKDNLVFEKDKC